MDTDQIRRLEPKLVQFLDHFHDCFSRKDTRAHLGVYVRGQLSDLPRRASSPSPSKRAWRHPLAGVPQPAQVG
jgi:hypothetical protein